MFPQLVIVIGLLTACGSAPQSAATELRGTASFRRIAAPVNADGTLNMVVEIPAGTNDKWEVDADGVMRWERLDDGKLRVVQYLAYPTNYGMVPYTILEKSKGGDGDPLDVLLVGPSVPRGMLVRVRPIGVLRLLEKGETDDKILAVPATGPMSDVTDLAQLEANYTGVTTILENWFVNYKGRGKLTFGGWGDAAAARTMITASTTDNPSRPK